MCNLCEYGMTPEVMQTLKVQLHMRASFCKLHSL